MEEKLGSALGRCDLLNLECDGLTRVLSYRLTKEGVRHRVMIGSIRTAKRNIDPHWWIELPDGRTIDYRARMWLGNDDLIPHGVFKREDFPNVKYEGEQHQVKVSDQVYQVLMSSCVFQEPPTQMSGWSSRPNIM